MTKANFGVLRDAYHAARSSYPLPVMKYVFSLLGSARNVLDIGCGTGIATRQLMKRVTNVYGLDYDEKMVQIAASNDNGINYCVATAEKMPFKSNSFDTATAFGAFHWFCSRESVSETRRILRNKGMLIVVNKNDIGDFREKYESIIKEITGVETPRSIKEGYAPAEILLHNGFSAVSKEKFNYCERYTIQRALCYIQSMSLWNLIQADKRCKILATFKQRLISSAKQGSILRPLEIVVVSGVN